MNVAPLKMIVIEERRSNILIKSLEMHAAAVRRTLHVDEANSRHWHTL
jgi:hypothetical protein